MSSRLLAGGNLLIDTATKAEAESFAEHARDRVPVNLSFQLDDGEQVDLSPKLARLFADVLSAVANGQVTIQTTPQELTTTVAADMLGVSRPTLMKWIASGELKAHKVGSHTRVKTEDLLTFGQSLRQKRQKSFDALREWDERFEGSN